jgi:hypothetical protein
MSNICLNNNVYTKLNLILNILPVHGHISNCMKSFAAFIIALWLDEH